MQVTHDTHTKIIVILTIKDKIKWNKMNNIGHIKSNNNDNYDNNKAIIIMILITIIMIIIIMIIVTVSQNN